MAMAATKAKAKGKGKGKGKEKTPDVPIEWAGKSIEELEALVAELENQLSSARQSRSLAQTEHASICSCYDVTREQIRELDMHIERTDLEIENAEEDSATELRLYEQKANFIKYCHATRLREASDESNQKMEASNAEHGQQVQGLEATKVDMKNALSKTEDQHTDEIGTLQRANKDDISCTKERLDANVKSFEQQCDDQHRQLQRELALRRETLLQLVESRKESHLEDITESHQHECDDMRGYFEGVERQQEMDIEDLEAEIRLLKKAAVQNEADSIELVESNERCDVALAVSSEKVAVLETKAKDKEKDATSLKSTNARLAATRRAIREATAKYEQLQETFTAAEEERDGIRGGIERATSEACRSDGTTQDEVDEELRKQNEQNSVLESHLQHIVGSAGLVEIRSR